jgi:hypothetical protein
MAYAFLRNRNAEAMMKSLIIAGFAALLVVGCQAPGPKSQALAYSGGDGSSQEQAVVIRDAACCEAGKLAERMWMGRKYPDYREAKQIAMNLAERHYDVFKLANSDGQTKWVYFDTTDFVNK